MEKATKLAETAAKLFEAGFSTKAAKKETLDYLNRAYAELRDAVMQTYLAIPHDDRTPAQTEVYYALPFDLYHYRTKQGELAIKVFPEAAPIVAEIERLSKFRANVAAAEVVKAAPKSKFRRSGPVTERTHTHRGTCQVCGRVQAVDNVKGTIAKHGYSVEWGFFSGTCGGSDELPLETSKAITEATIEHLETVYAPAAEKRASDILEGVLEPEFTKAGPRDRLTFQPTRVKCERSELSTFELQLQLRVAIASAEMEARRARGHAADLRRMIGERHGQPLYAVE